MDNTMATCDGVNAPFLQKRFNTLIEVVPPDGSNPDRLLSKLSNLSGLSFEGFSVATNPVAKPRMSAMALCALIQQTIRKPAILHCTTRDHNRLSLQSLLWGAIALNIKTVLAATGDMVALGDRAITTHVKDATVFELISMARKDGLFAGAVFDPHPESNGLTAAVRRLQKKADAGAQFAVSQPVYDEKTADEIITATKDIDIPIIMGILPLRTARHAEFLHHKVAGIAVPKNLRQRMAKAKDPAIEGVANARELLTMAKERFYGACIMPPFDHYEILFDLLQDD
jgi:methylenetetrahydrofolate reductase (NADPH)